MQLMDRPYQPPTTPVAEPFAEHATPQCLVPELEPAHPPVTGPMQLMDGPYQPSNELDPNMFTLSDNRGIDTEQTFASGLFNLGAMQAHMPKTGFTGLMDGDWTQDMQFWDNAPNVFGPEVQARLPPFNASPLVHIQGPSSCGSRHTSDTSSASCLTSTFATPGSHYAHNASSSHLLCAFATSGSCYAHDTISSCLTSSGRLPCTFATSGSQFWDSPGPISCIS
ncbi:hypothetical protein CCMSSC00406_0008475 [Pleurotus cornucopiae]|uniref:Uncharacterized protein n=1 Tax=Pleurotus cornucopiae TaxID=5321 RepID=A0ACB7IIU5_PLECO|nr:hypothetical protein CCMSSC00406_0008475 [Pleurotus cornucopiae]